MVKCSTTALLNNSYIDDIYVGNESADKTAKDLHQLIYVLKQGDFPPQKVVANDKKILMAIDDDIKGPTDYSSIYGQNWDLEKDTLTFNFKNKIDPISKNRYTKRQLQSEMMSLYETIADMEN